MKEEQIIVTFHNNVGSRVLVLWFLKVKTSLYISNYGFVKRFC